MKLKISPIVEMTLEKEIPPIVGMTLKKEISPIVEMTLKKEISPIVGMTSNIFLSFCLPAKGWNEVKNLMLTMELKIPHRS